MKIRVRHIYKPKKWNLSEPARVHLSAMPIQPSRPPRRRACNSAARQYVYLPPDTGLVSLQVETALKHGHRPRRRGVPRFSSERTLQGLDLHPTP